MADIINRDDAPNAPESDSPSIINRDDAPNAPESDSPSIINRDDDVLSADAPVFGGIGDAIRAGAVVEDGPGDDIFVPGVSPAKDSDNDGLFDRTEERIGTDPEARDTDGDGVSDYNEIAHGTNPLDADDHIDLDD